MNENKEKAKKNEKDLTDVNDEKKLIFILNLNH